MTTDDRVLALVAVAAAGVYSWVAAGLRPFTVEQEVMVAIPAVVVLVAALRPHHTPGSGAAVRASRGSAALWLGLVALAFAWELAAYFSSAAVGPSDAERHGRRGHERAPGAGIDLPALAHARMAAGPKRGSGTAMTSRTFTFTGYGLILALTIVLTAIAAGRANWMTLPGAFGSLTAQEAGADPGGGGMDMAGVAPLRQGKRRLRVTVGPDNRWTSSTADVHARLVTDAGDHWSEGFFDEWYLHVFAFPGPDQSDAEVEGLRRMLSDPPARVLDVACGPGRHGIRLAEMGYRVTGIDSSRLFLALRAVRSESTSSRLRGRRR